MASERKQINFRADDALLEAIAETQRLDDTTRRPPNTTEAIERAIYERRDRLRRKAERRK